MVGSSFSDYTVKIDDLIADGEKVAAHVTASGTHSGPFMGAPATGHPVRIEGIEIFRIANGMVVERWGVFDLAGLMMQVGMMPHPPAG